MGKLAGLQTDRINRALDAIGSTDADTVRRFLRAMIDRDDPDKVLQTILEAGNAGAKDQASPGLWPCAKGPAAGRVRQHRPSGQVERVAGLW